MPAYSMPHPCAKSHRKSPSDRNSYSCATGFRLSSRLRRSSTTRRTRTCLSAKVNSGQRSACLVVAFRAHVRIRATQVQQPKPIVDVNLCETHRELSRSADLLPVREGLSGETAGTRPDSPCGTYDSRPSRKTLRDPAFAAHPAQAGQSAGIDGRLAARCFLLGCRRVPEAIQGRRPISLRSACR